MTRLLIYQAPRRDGQMHLSRRGHRTLCGRQISESWQQVGLASESTCRRCIVAAWEKGYTVPYADLPEPTP